MAIKLSNVVSSIIISHLLTLPLSAESIGSCMQEKLISASDTVTVGELRQSCQQEIDLVPTAIKKALINEESAVTRRLRLERAGSNKLFSLQPHKPNYIILSNNIASANEQPFAEAFPNRDVYLQPWETKFQISLKVPVARDIFSGNGDLFVAYTNRSFWQQFNKEGSSPFRESNHEPEVWLSFKNDSERAMGI